MKYSIGVDLGGTNISVGLVSITEKKIIAKVGAKTNAPRSCEEISKEIVDLCHDVCANARVKYECVEWIGVATPGIVKDGVVVSAVNLGWTNAPFSKILKKLSGKKIYVANDANTAAYAESVWGVGENELSLVAVTLGTGVGGGIVIYGKIWEGMNGFAAEIGHMTIDSEGRICGCGKRGCFESYCSATALVSESKRAMKLDDESLMWKMCDNDISKMNAVIPFRAAEEGDVSAKSVVDEFIKYLAIGISNIINMFQPDIVCIGGGISGEGENIMKPLRRRLKQISFGASGNRTKVEVAKYRNDAGIIGGALLALQEERAKAKNQIQRLTENFNVKGDFVSARPYGNGHINDTRYVQTKDNDGSYAYILQKINKNVFKKPSELMENYVGVTEYLKKIIIKNGGDPMRETINVIKSKSGKDYYIDESGEYWRMLVFVTDSLSYDKVERPEQFYESAVAFGNFQYMLRDYPAETLNETIPNFHNTPDRIRLFKEALDADKCKRAASVKDEIKFVLDREGFAATLENARKEGKLPLRVTHNDTKLNNILFDNKTGNPICVVDLDTIMPGYSVNDFGDSIRFGATTALEDEADLSKVNFDISLYELYVKGFIEGAKGGLTAGELEMLPIGAMMMTFECGTRFLTDYLSGDTYFKISRPNHNLDRARNQFKLVSDMEKKLGEMREIVKKYSQNKA